MTDFQSHLRRPQSSVRRFLAPLLIAGVVAPLGVAVVTSGSAQADPPALLNPSYQLGYARAVLDVQTMASRMRAEGFELADIDISSRIPTLCTREADSALAVSELNSPEFLQGCADGMNHLVKAGIAY